MRIKKYLKVYLFLNMDGVLVLVISYAVYTG
jgi:hypothetical protein